MKSLLSLPAARIFPWRFWFQYSNAVVPVQGIYRTAHIMSKHEITGGRVTLYNFCNPVFSTFSHQSKYDTVSSSCASEVNDYLEKRHVIDSSKRHEHKGRDDKQVSVPLIEQVYDELMTAPKWLTSDEWSALGAKVYNESFLLALWPTLLLNYIAHKSEAVPGLYSVGMSLIDYIASLSDRHRLLRLVSAVAICIHHGGEENREKGLALYDELCAEYDVFDPVSAHILITALARTRYWRHCLELIEQIKLAADPSSKDYSSIIVAAMVNGDNDLANELLATLSRNYLMPDDRVFMHILASATAEQVLAVLKDFAWIPSRPLIDSVITHLQSQPYGRNLLIKETKIAKNGICHQCGSVLERHVCITDEEFVELRQAFMNKSLIRNGNIFIQSSPEELSAFRHFLEQHQSHPFTVVFDGLNIASCTGEYARNKSWLLQQAISSFVCKGHRVLVFGRQHMKSWEVYKRSGSAHVGWFFTQNVSSDDPFILYAALYFGQQTFIVTNDEFRDHSIVLVPEMEARVKLWQRQRQITFRRNFTGKFYFNWPSRYKTAVQQSACGWHVPFEDGSERLSYSLPDAWYCIQNKKSR